MCHHVKGTIFFIKEILVTVASKSVKCKFLPAIFRLALYVFFEHDAPVFA